MLNSLILRIGKWPGQGLAVGETLAGPRSVPLSLGEHLVGLLCQLPCSFALFSLLSPSQGLLLDFCLQSSGEEPLTSPSVQGSSALTSPLLWLKRCKSGEVSVALSKCWTQPHFVKSKSVKSKQYKLHVWWQVACPDHLGIVPSGVKWILFHQPCVSCITFPQDRITLCSGGAWRRWSRSWSGEKLYSPQFMACLWWLIHVKVSGTDANFGFVYLFLFSACTLCSRAVLLLV